MAAAGSAVAAWGVQALRAGVRTNDLMQRTRQSLTTLLGDAQSAEEQLTKLWEFGKTAAFAFPLFVEAQQQMIAFGVETEKVIPLLEGVQNAVLAGGGTEESFRSVSEVLARMSSSAEITKGDLNILGTHGVNAAKIVAKEFGVTEAQMRTMLTEGEVDVNQFFDAFAAGADEMFGGVADNYQDTFSGSVAWLKGVQRRIGEILVSPFIDPEGGGAAITIMNGVTDALTNLETALRPVVEDLTPGLESSMQGVADAIARVGEHITESSIKSFIETMKEFAPVIASLSAAGIATFASSLLGMVGLGGVASAINPISAALIALVATSPELRTAFGDLLETFMPLLPVIADLAKILAEGLMDILPVVAMLITAIVVPAVSTLVTLFGPVLQVAIQGVAIALGFVGSILVKVAEFFTFLTSGTTGAKVAMIALGAVVGAVLVGTLPMMAKYVFWQGLMIANHIRLGVVAMASAIKMAAAWLIALGPIGIIIAIIAAIVVAIIVYWDQVKAATIAVFTAIGNFFVTVWMAIWNFLKTVGTAIWNFFKAVWSGISSVVSAAMNFIVPLVVGAWRALWSFLGPLLRHIGNIFKTIFTNIRNVIVAVWSFIEPYVMAAWNRIKVAAQVIFRAIGAVFTWLKENVWDNLVAGTKLGVRLIKGFWNGLKTAASTIFDGIRGTIEWFRDKFMAVKNKIGDFVDTIKDKWNGLKDTAETVWNTIKNMIKTPIKFVIDTIYNNGIKKFWNWIDDKLFDGKHQLSEVSLSGWRKGGPVYGRGSTTSDSIPARLSRDEHVWTAREVSAAGGHQAVAAMRSRALGGKSVSMGPGNGEMAFAHGGAWWDHLIDPLKGDPADIVPDAGQDFFTNAFELAAKLPGWIKDLWDGHDGIPGVSGFKDRIKGAMKKAIQQFIDMATGLSNMGAGGPGDYKAMSAWIKGIVPGTSITSGFRQGDPGYHGKGQAIDMAFSDGSERRGGGKAEEAFLAIVAAWKSSIAELIWDYSPWGQSLGVWNGKRHTFSSPTSGPGTHADHIHWASTADTGVGGGGGDVQRWRETVISALRAAGESTAPGIVDMVLRSINQESGGNPSAVNDYDINARLGHPSKGLNQVIQPTFNSYAGAYQRRGVFDPFANIYASIKYARARYGSNWAATMAAPGGYRHGGALSFDNGGMLPTGYSIAHNGTGRPEPVGHDLAKGKGDTYNFHFHGPVADRRGAEDLVVQGLHDAKRHGRLD